jgi:hypothetical protein
VGGVSDIVVDPTSATPGAAGSIEAAGAAGAAGGDWGRSDGGAAETPSTAGWTLASGVASPDAVGKRISAIGSTGADRAGGIAGGPGAT